MSQWCASHGAPVNALALIIGWGFLGGVAVILAIIAVPLVCELARGAWMAATRACSYRWSLFRGRYWLWRNKVGYSPWRAFWTAL